MIWNLLRAAAGYAIAAALVPQVSFDLRETHWWDFGTYALIGCGVLIVIGVEHVVLAIFTRFLLWAANRAAEKNPTVENLARRTTANALWGKKR